MNTLHGLNIRLFGRLIASVALLCLASHPAFAQSDNHNESDVIPFSIAKMIIEFNATDEDVGVQVLLDGEPYKRLKIFRPDGREMLDLRAIRSLEEQGLTELFFES